MISFLVISGLISLPLLIVLSRRRLIDDYINNKQSKPILNTRIGSYSTFMYFNDTGDTVAYTILKCIGRQTDSNILIFENRGLTVYIPCNCLYSYNDLYDILFSYDVKVEVL